MGLVALACQEPEGAGQPADSLQARTFMAQVPWLVGLEQSVGLEVMFSNRELLWNRDVTRNATAIAVSM